MNKDDITVKALLNDTQISYTALIALILLGSFTVISVLIKFMLE